MSTQEASFVEQPIVHSVAAIVSSGDEIITGQLLDTNAHWLAQRLLEHGIIAVERATIGDDAQTIAETLRRLAARYPLIVMTGGLGPTEGDLTRQGLAMAMGEELVRDDSTHAALTAMLARRGREMTSLQARQAMRPKSARCLSNAMGTAPGLCARLRVGGGECRGADVVCLPGPPGELQPMWREQVAAMLRPPAGRTVVTRLLRVVAMPEAEAVRRLGPLMARDRHPLVGITASQGVLTLRMRFDAVGTREEAQAALDADEREARAALGVHVLSGEPESVAACIVGKLAARGRRLVVAESCTGGLLAAAITAVPGASAVFEGGWLVYSNGAKVRELGVGEELIASKGAVSAEVAAAMAVGALRRSGGAAVATDALAVTGIAGPDGGSASKPVGTVCVARASTVSAAPSPGGAAHNQVEVRTFLFPGNREDVRQRAAQSALVMLYLAMVQGEGAPIALNWQMGAGARSEWA